MSDQYVGEIRMFAGNFAPEGWMFCQGALVSISDYEVLYTLIGTTYGGDGQSTFGLPNLASRLPVHIGAGSGLTSYVAGQTAGVESVTLSGPQLPTHTHALTASSGSATTAAPGGGIIATPSGGGLPFRQETPDVNLNAGSVSFVGGNGSHDNMMPFLGINFIIAMFGLYPTQN